MASVADVERAVAIAASEGMSGPRTAVAERATCLERAADLIEHERGPLIALAVREGGKTLVNAQGEIREAADYCRYYAAQARRELAPATPRGPMACIAPWDFPLAIFFRPGTGALAPGHPMLPKP